MMNGLIEAGKQDVCVCVRFLGFFFLMKLEKRADWEGWQLDYWFASTMLGSLSAQLFFFPLSSFPFLKV